MNSDRMYDEESFNNFGNLSDRKRATDTESGQLNTLNVSHNIYFENKLNGGLDADVTAKWEDSTSELGNFVKPGNNMTNSMTSSMMSLNKPRRGSREQVGFALESLDYALNAIEKKKEEENLPGKAKRHYGPING